MVCKDGDVESPEHLEKAILMLKQTSRVQGCYMNDHTSIHSKMKQPSDQWICPVLRLVQIKKTKSNRSNRIETIIMIFQQPTTPQANCKNHVKVVKAFQGPVTDSKLKRSLDDRRSSAICTVLGMFMGWCGDNPCATFLFASNKFTWDHLIPLHFGCRHMSDIYSFYMLLYTFMFF